MNTAARCENLLFSSPWSTTTVPPHESAESIRKNTFQEDTCLPRCHLTSGGAPSQTQMSRGMLTMAQSLKGLWPNIRPHGPVEWSTATPGQTFPIEGRKSALATPNSLYEVPMLWAPRTQAVCYNNAYLHPIFYQRFGKQRKQHSSCLRKMSKKHVINIYHK